jgi:hypothetical protein
MRSPWLWIALSLGAIAVVWCGWSRVSERWFRRKLLEANREIAPGLHQLARQHFSILTVKRPGQPEAAYQLGLCEEILGHFNSAEAVWFRIPATSPFARRSSLRSHLGHDGINQVLDDARHGPLSLASAGADDLTVGERRAERPLAGLVQNACEQAFIDVEELAMNE